MLFPQQSASHKQCNTLLMCYTRWQLARAVNYKDETLHMFQQCQALSTLNNIVLQTAFYLPQKGPWDHLLTDGNVAQRDSQITARGRYQTWVCDAVHH